MESRFFDHTILTNSRFLANFIVVRNNKHKETTMKPGIDNPGDAPVRTFNLKTWWNDNLSFARKLLIHQIWITVLGSAIFAIAYKFLPWNPAPILFLLALIGIASIFITYEISRAFYPTVDTPMTVSVHACLSVLAVAEAVETIRSRALDFEHILVTILLIVLAIYSNEQTQGDVRDTGPVKNFFNKQFKAQYFLTMSFLTLAIVVFWR